MEKSDPIEAVSKRDGAGTDFLKPGEIVREYTFLRCELQKQYESTLLFLRPIRILVIELICTGISWVFHRRLIPFTGNIPITDRQVVLWPSSIAMGP
jgi:hypothetical protein